MSLITKKTIQAFKTISSISQDHYPVGSQCHKEKCTTKLYFDRPIASV